MTKVFMSYRRDDSASAAGRIRDRLVEAFNKDSVFTDVDSVPLGVDFREVIESSVAQCDIFLAIIGRNWLTITDEEGRPRLTDPQDFVLIELQSALRRRIPVIPVLVDGASMPTVDELPPSLRELGLRNGMFVRSDPDFHRDADRLIAGLKGHLPDLYAAKPEPISPKKNGGHSAQEYRRKYRSMMALWTIIAATTGVTGYLIGVHKDGVIDTVDTARESTSIEANAGASRNSQEVSTDIDRPVRLSSNEISGTGVGEHVSHYYVFWGGPGEIKLTVDGKNRGGAGVAQAVRVELSTRSDADILLDIHLGNTTKDKRVIRRVATSSRQELILRIILHPATIDYLVRVEGAVDF